jgi:putative hydrolase of the HAD superfamily
MTTGRARGHASGAGAGASRPALEAVFFDAGGTLVRLDFEWMAAAVRQLGFATDPESLRRGEIEGRRRYDRSRGVRSPGDPWPLGAVGDIRAYFGGILVGAGCPPHLVNSAVTWCLAHEKANGLWARPMEGAREALDAIGAMGLRRAAISNSDGRAEWHLEQTGLRHGLEFVVDSHLVGVEKPDPGIFRIALERMAVAPERSLFVGDIRSVDETGARAAGLHFVLMDPFADYAEPGTPAIRGMHELAGWVTRCFEVHGNGSGRQGGVP